MESEAAVIAERPDLRAVTLSELPVIGHEQDNHMYRLDTVWQLRPEIVDRVAEVRARLAGMVIDEFLGAALLTLGACTVESLINITRALDESPSKSIN